MTVFDDPGLRKLEQEMHAVHFDNALTAKLHAIKLLERFQFPQTVGDLVITDDEVRQACLEADERMAFLSPEKQAQVRDTASYILCFANFEGDLL